MAAHIPTLKELMDLNNSSYAHLIGGDFDVTVYKMSAEDWHEKYGDKIKACFCIGEAAVFLQKMHYFYDIESICDPMLPISVCDLYRTFMRYLFLAVDCAKYKLDIKKARKDLGIPSLLKEYAFINDVTIEEMGLRKHG